jgi:hypothetical protein
MGMPGPTNNEGEGDTMHGNRLEAQAKKDQAQKHTDAEYTQDERSMRIYRIIRMYGPSSNKKARTIKNGLTLQEAQQHCSDPKTSGDNWFDGYDLMKGIKRGKRTNSDEGDTMETITQTLGNGNVKKFKIINGTAYSLGMQKKGEEYMQEETPQAVVEILENAMRTGLRLRLHYGDPVTGKTG